MLAFAADHHEADAGAVGVLHLLRELARFELCFDVQAGGAQLLRQRERGFEATEIVRSGLASGDGAREAPRTPAIHFEISSAYQGEEGIAYVHRAASEGTPFALAFMDVRIPPGLDGIESLVRIWQEDPALQAVICSAYSDYSWAALIERLPFIDDFDLRYNNRIRIPLPTTQAVM